MQREYRDIAELNKLYDDADAASYELHAEQKNNLLLVAGLHYHKHNSQLASVVSKNEQLTQTQKVRLTKNHIQKITKNITNAYIHYCGGIAFSPRNESELQDQKAAEMHRSAWGDISEEIGFNKIERRSAKDLSEIGECIYKVFHDQNAGPIVGYEPLLVDGEEVVDDEGIPFGNDKKPVREGKFIAERIHGFNLLVDPNATSFEEKRYCVYRKMMDVEVLKKRYAKDPDKVKGIQVSSEETYRVFDSLNGTYYDSNGMVMVREFYFAPEEGEDVGTYQYATPHIILEEGELTDGDPIFYDGFNEVSTSPRAFGVIKDLRPYQIEVNRLASHICQTQLTLSDKLLINAGTTITAGGTAHGVKAIKYAGMKPEIMMGRDAGNFLPLLDHEINEMYRISPISEEWEEDPGGQVDPYTLLFRSLRNKKRFSVYSEKHKDFKLAIVKYCLNIARKVWNDEKVIKVCGRVEQDNIAEFKNPEQLKYILKIEETDEDLESKLGKQITLNQALQYAGSSLPKEVIGAMIEDMPYAGKVRGLNKLTQNSRLAKNVLLALDRGEFLMPTKHDDHAFMAQELAFRMREPDYKHLSEQIKQNYSRMLAIYETALKEQAQAVERAKSGLIPTTGQLVGCDIYVPMTNKKGEPTQRRLRVPYDGLNWLIQKMKDQGNISQHFEGMDQSVVADVGNMMSQDNAKNSNEPSGGNNQSPPQ